MSLRFFDLLSMDYHNCIHLWLKAGHGVQRDPSKGAIRMKQFIDVFDFYAFTTGIVKIGIGFCTGILWVRAIISNDTLIT